MRTSAVGSAAAEDITKQVEEKFLEFFEDQEELRWAIHLSNEVEQDREDLWKVLHGLRAAEFHLENIEDDTLRDNDLREVFGMVEELRDEIWELEEKLDYHDRGETAESPGDQSSLSDIDE